MPLPKGTRYRMKKVNGKMIRLAFAPGSNKVIEAKTMKSGANHTPSEFAADRKKKLKRAVLRK